MEIKYKKYLRNMMIFKYLLFKFYYIKLIK
jgi:hypothetical protein